MATEEVSTPRRDGLAATSNGDAPISIPYTPKSSHEKDLYKYYCPICMEYFKSIFKTKCCANYICQFCICNLMERQLHKMEAKQQAALEEMLSTPSAGDGYYTYYGYDAAADVESYEEELRPYTITGEGQFIVKDTDCPFCNSSQVHMERVRHEERIRSYEDSPSVAKVKAPGTGSGKNKRLQMMGNGSMPSPLKIGDSYERMRVKMLSFEQVANQDSNGSEYTTPRTPKQRPKSAPSTSKRRAATSENSPTLRDLILSTVDLGCDHDDHDTYIGEHARQLTDIFHDATDETNPVVRMRSISRNLVDALNEVSRSDDDHNSIIPGGVNLTATEDGAEDVTPSSIQNSARITNTKKLLGSAKKRPLSAPLATKYRERWLKEITSIGTNNTSNAHTCTEMHTPRSPTQSLPAERQPDMSPIVQAVSAHSHISALATSSSGDHFSNDLSPIVLLHQQQQLLKQQRQRELEEQQAQEMRLRQLEQLEIQRQIQMTDQKRMQRTSPWSPVRHKNNNSFRSESFNRRHHPPHELEESGEFEAESCCVNCCCTIL